MTHMERSSWIGRDKLNQQLLTGAPLAAAKIRTFAQYPGHRGGSHGWSHTQIDETRPGNLCPGH
jgi:hypothetical protein